jgi:hypothetical protein
MIRTKLYVKKINYNTLIKLLMPYIEQWLTEKDNFFLDMISKIISTNGRPTKFTDLLVCFVPRKDDLAAAILLHFDEVMIEYLNHMLSRNGILALIISIKTDTIERKNESLIRIEMDMDIVDYVTSMEHLLPQIIHWLSKTEYNSGRIGNLLLGMKELPVKMMKGAIEAIPIEERDELVTSILTEYKIELRDILNSIILKNNIRAEINAIKIENHPYGI